MSWQERALCRSHPEPELWFSEDASERREAQRLCGECVVIAECDVAGRDERYGVWAGKDRGAAERQRRYRWEQRHKRTCEWCSEVFFWQAKPHVRPPAFCSDECDKALRLARAAELYRERLEATG